MKDIIEYVKNHSEKKDGYYRVSNFGDLDDNSSDREWTDALSAILVKNAEALYLHGIETGETKGKLVTKIEKITGLLKRTV